MESNTLHVWFSNQVKPKYDTNVFIELEKEVMIGYVPSEVKSKNWYACGAHPNDKRKIPFKEIISWRYLNEDEEIISNYGMLKAYHDFNETDKLINWYYNKMSNVG